MKLSLEYILESLPHGVAVANNRGEFLFTNNRFRDLFGYSESEFKEVTIYHVTHPDDIALSLDKFSLLQKKGSGNYKIQKRYLKKCGTSFWAQSTVEMKFDPDTREELYFLTTEELKEREDKLERFQELQDITQELKEALRIRDQFLSVASHELLTPLTSLKLQVQIQERRLQKSGEITLEHLSKLLSTFNGGVKHMSRLVEDMLDVGRITTGRMAYKTEPFKMNELVKEVLDNFKEQFEREGYPEAEFKYSGDTSGVWDRTRISQVVFNLISNAIKYGRKKSILVEVKGQNKNLTIHVKDHGMGIRPEKLESIFERFERDISASEVSGLGLGLFISKQIIEDLGGSIKVTSKLNVGSEFVVTLPRKFELQLNLEKFLKKD